MTPRAAETDKLNFWSFIDFALAATQRELPGIDPLAMRVVLTLHRAASMLVYDLESTVHRPRGLSWAGFRVVFVIWLAGPLEAKKVAELSGMSRAAVSSLITTLERDGLITKERSPRDGRAVELGLTRSGREAIRKAFTAHNVREQAWASSLTPDEQQTLIRLLDKVTANATQIDAKQRS